MTEDVHETRREIPGCNGSKAGTGTSKAGQAFIQQSRTIPIGYHSVGQPREKCSRGSNKVKHRCAFD